jgi:TonB family protein
VSTAVPYPEGEVGAAEVVVLMTVSATGTVSDASVVSGAEPFASVALEAVRTWAFVPARRDGRAVPARIRYTLRFTPPDAPVAPEVPTPKPTPAKPGRVASPASAPSGEFEVVVRGERPTPGSVTVTREEARALPGTFGDPLRAVEAQPGVVPIVSGLPSFFIRGAPPANVGFFIDGVDVPLLYHAFFGPSVIQPALIEEVELHAGSAPVEFGRFAGPIVSVTTSKPQGRLNGEAGLRAIDVGAFGEAPFGGCGGPSVAGCARGNVRAGGRYSYTGVVLSLLSEAELDYWDYQADASYALDRRNTIGVLAFGAYDFFRSPGDVRGGGGEVEFHRADLRWSHATPSGTSLRTAVTLGYDHTGGADPEASAVSDRSVRARSTLKTPLGKDAELQAGVDVRVDRFELETNPLFLSFPDYSELFPERTDLVVGAHLSAAIEPSPGVRFVPGVRSDVYFSRGTTAVGVDPRVSAEFDVGRRLTLIHTLGVAHQRPNFAPQVPGAQVADLTSGLQRAVLFSYGARLRLPAEFTATSTVFRTAYFNALDPIGGARDFSIDRRVLGRRSTISAMGFEFKLARPITHKVGGFLAYTLSRSEQSAGALKTVSGFDRTHVLQAAVSYDFGSGFRSGLRGVFYSGVPELNFQGTPHFVSERRGSPYFRLDARLEKRFRLGEDGYWSVVGEVLNATSTREVVRLDCGRVCAERVAGPVILPSVGVEVGL